MAEVCNYPIVLIYLLPQGMRLIKTNWFKSKLAIAKSPLNTIEVLLELERIMVYRPQLQEQGEANPPIKAVTSSDWVISKCLRAVCTGLSKVTTWAIAHHPIHLPLQMDKILILAVLVP